MNRRYDAKVQMIPIDQITVLNPRPRKKKFTQIVANIAKLGLKKPITVARRRRKRRRGRGTTWSAARAGWKRSWRSARGDSGHRRRGDRGRNCC